MTLNSLGWLSWDGTSADEAVDVSGSTMLTGRLRLDSAFLDVVVLRETLLVLSLSRSKTWLKGRLEAREDDGVLDRERRVGGSVAAGTEIEQVSRQWLGRRRPCIFC